jgi:Ca-activated chloride channel homolog
MINQKLIFSLLFAILITTLFSCNSNAQPTSITRYPIEPSPTPVDIAYRASGKQSTSSNMLTLSSAFNNDYYTNTETNGSFYAELKADEYRNDYAKRVPLNLSIVIDRSGSMSGEKIRRAKESAQFIVDQMESSDYLSIVTYDQAVQIVVPATHVSNKNYIKNAISSIVDRGSTNLAGGAIEGYSQVKKYYSKSYINRVILLSDGLANEGITDPVKIERIVKNQLYENGISISTFGIGRDYNEDLMTAMAENGNGNYYFIDNANDIAGIFQKELRGLSQIVAQNVQLKITLPENVNVTKVYGGKYEQTGRVLTMDVRDMFSQETKAILIKYNINRNVNSTIAFATQLSFNPIDNKRTEFLKTINKQEFTTNYNVYNQNFSEWVMAQDILYKTNENLENAMKEVDRGNYDNARKMVDDNDKYLKDNAPMVKKSLELQRASTANVTYSDKIVNAESMDAETKKVVQKASKSSNYQIRSKK